MLTLGRAALHCGVSKGTISKAIATDAVYSGIAPIVLRS
jgi:hypothetical protein